MQEFFENFFFHFLKYAITALLTNESAEPVANQTAYVKALALFLVMVRNQ